MINKLQIKGLHSPNHQHLPGSKMVYSIECYFEFYVQFLLIADMEHIL